MSLPRPPVRDVRDVRAYEPEPDGPRVGGGLEAPPHDPPRRRWVRMRPGTRAAMRMAVGLTAVAAVLVASGGWDALAAVACALAAILTAVQLLLFVLSGGDRAVEDAPDRPAGTRPRVLRALWRTPSSRWLTLASALLSVWWVESLVEPGWDLGYKLPSEVFLALCVAGLMYWALTIAVREACEMDRADHEP